MNRRSFWTLNKLLVAVLIGGFLVLMNEIRFDHRQVLEKHPVAWTPILYSGVMVVAGVVALLAWEHGGRVTLLAAFALGVVIGPLGCWFHSMGHPARGVQRTLSAWTVPVHAARERGPAGEEQDAAGPGDALETPPPGASANGERKKREKGEHAALEHPPILAPLTFLGLGLMGMLACMRRFQPRLEERDAGVKTVEPPGRTVHRRSGVQPSGG